MYTLCFFQKGCDDSVYNVSLSVAMPEEVKGLAVPPTVFVCMENGEASVLQTQLTKIWPTLGNFSEFAYDLKINKSQLCVNVSTCFVDVPGDCEDSQLFRLAAFRELLGPQLRLNLSFSFTPHRFCLNPLRSFCFKILVFHVGSKLTCFKFSERSFHLHLTERCSLIWWKHFSQFGGKKSVRRIASTPSRMWHVVGVLWHFSHLWHLGRNGEAVSSILLLQFSLAEALWLLGASLSTWI